MSYQQMALGTNNSNVKSRNLSAILLTLLLRENVSRVHLAPQLGVSTATITNLVSELIDMGLVVEEGFVKSEGVGRPQRTLKLVTSARYAIGVHINVGTVHINLTDLASNPITTYTFEHDVNAPWQSVLDQIIDNINQLVNKADIPHETIVGVGIAASGLVDPYTGINLIAPNLNWKNVPIQDYVHERLNLPVAVDNNVRAMALGESLFGVAKSFHSVAFVYAIPGLL